MCALHSQGAILLKLPINKAQLQKVAAQLQRVHESVTFS